MRNRLFGKVILGLLALQGFNACSAQNSGFQKTFGAGTVNYKTISVLETSNKGYAILCLREKVLCIIKTDSLGNQEWSESYPLLSKDNYPVSATPGFIRSKDKGYLIYGEPWQSFLLKTDSLGKVQWTKTYIGPGYYNWFDGFGKVIELNDGYVVTAGNIFLMKTDLTGNVKWVTKINDSSLNNQYGHFQEMVQLKSDSCFYLVGQYGSLPSYTYKIIKINKKGVGIWGKQITNPINNQQIRIQEGQPGKLTISLSGNYNQGLPNYLFTIDSSGTVSKTLRFPIGANSSDPLDNWSSYKKSTENSLITASAQPDVYGNPANKIVLSKYDSLGNLLWSRKTIGTRELSEQSLLITTDGGMAVAGVTTGVHSGAADLFFLKTDGSGQIACNTDTVHTVSGVSVSGVVSLRDLNDTFSYFQSGGDSSLVITSVPIKDAGFDVCACNPPQAGFIGDFHAPTVDFTDTSTWAIRWIWDFGDGGTDSVHASPSHLYLDTTKTYNVCLTVLNTCGVSSVCQTIKHHTSPAGVVNSATSMFIPVFPNPTQGVIHFTLPSANAGVPISLEVTDVFGRIVTARNGVQKDLEQLDLSDFPSGIYFLKLRFEEHVFVQKILLNH
jgi:hypothetical protein